MSLCPRVPVLLLYTINCVVPLTTIGAFVHRQHRIEHLICRSAHSGSRPRAQHCSRLSAQSRQARGVVDDYHRRRRNNRSDRCTCTPLCLATFVPLNVREPHVEGRKVAIIFILTPNPGKLLANILYLFIGSQLAYSVFRTIRGSREVWPIYFNHTSRAYTTNYYMGHIPGLRMTYGFMVLSSLRLFYRYGIPNIMRLIRCLLRLLPTHRVARTYLHAMWMPRSRPVTIML